MKKQYRYTLLKQNGKTKDLGVSERKTFKEMYKILKCTIIQIIPISYYSGHGNCSMYGDEEGRFSSKNKRNPHFKVLFCQITGADFDVIGDILKEKRSHS